MLPILAIATTFLQLAPGIFKTIQEAIPAAEKFFGLIRGEHVDPAALDAFLAEIKANSDRIQRPITE